MVQDEFSRSRFCYGSAFWVYRDSVSVEQRQGLDLDMDLDMDLDLDLDMDLDLDLSLCGAHTVSLCGTHTVQGGGRAVRGQLQPHTGASQSPPHTSKIAIPQLRGEK